MRYSPDHCPNGNRCTRQWGSRYCECFWACTKGKEWKEQAARDAADVVRAMQEAQKKKD